MRGAYKIMDKKAKGIIVDIALLLGFSFLILVFSETVCEFFPKLSAFVLMFEIIIGIIFWIIIIFSIIGKKTLGHRIAENFDKNKKFFIAICCFTVFSFILYFCNMNFNVTDSIMKKLLIIYFVISFLMLIVYALFAINAYVSIKYEVETISSDIVTSAIYQIYDIGIIGNLIYFCINVFVVIGLYSIFRRKQKNSMSK